MWLGSYPNQFPPKQQTQMGAFLLDPIGYARLGLNIDKWKPEFADMVWARKPLVNEGQFIYDVIAYQRLGLSLDKWQPIYPDFARTRLPLVAEGQFSYDVNSYIGVLPDRWLPVYPDPRHFLFRKPLVWQEFAYIELALIEIGTMGFTLSFEGGSVVSAFDTIQVRQENLQIK